MAYKTESEVEHAIQTEFSEYLDRSENFFCLYKPFGLIIYRKTWGRNVNMGQVRFHVGPDKVEAEVWSDNNTDPAEPTRRLAVYIDLHDPDSFRKIKDQFETDMYRYRIEHKEDRSGSGSRRCLLNRWC
jgi:hypothetical protein